MEQNIKKWLWQHKNYPAFPYDKIALQEIIAKIEYNRGQLDGMAQLFVEKDIKEIEIDALIEESIHTSEIEGEYFKRDSVRSSGRNVRYEIVV